MVSPEGMSHQALSTVLQLSLLPLNLTQRAERSPKTWGWGGGSPMAPRRPAVVQSLSCVQLFETPWTAALQAPLSSIFRSLLKFMSIESGMLSNHFILCCPLLLLPSIFLSIRVFSNELALCLRWPKYWNFSFSISPSNEYSGLISYRIDQFDLIAVQGTPWSLLQHHNSKASILQHSALFVAQVSHLCMTPGKTIVSLYKPLSAK